MGWSVAGLACAWLLSSSVAWACPMCFSGGNSNTKAFMWGSLFLMIVPTSVMGTLGYLAYKRIKAIDGGISREPISMANHMASVVPQASGAAAEPAEATVLAAPRPALRVVPPA